VTPAVSVGNHWISIGAFLQLGKEVAGSLLIPPAVHDEIVVNRAGVPGAADVEQAD